MSLPVYKHAYAPICRQHDPTPPITSICIMPTCHLFSAPLLHPSTSPSPLVLRVPLLVAGAREANYHLPAASIDGSESVLAPASEGPALGRLIWAGCGEGHGEMVWGRVGCATTQLLLDPPHVPTVSNRGCTYVQISWLDHQHPEFYKFASDQDETDEYKVWFRPEGADKGVKQEDKEFAKSAHRQFYEAGSTALRSFEIRDLAPFTEYSIAVTARRYGDWTAQSEPVMISTFDASQVDRRVLALICRSTTPSR